MEIGIVINREGLGVIITEGINVMSLRTCLSVYRESNDEVILLKEADCHITLKTVIRNDVNLNRYYEK